MAPDNMLVSRVDCLKGSRSINKEFVVNGCNASRRLGCAIARAGYCPVFVTGSEVERMVAIAAGYKDHSRGLRHLLFITYRSLGKRLWDIFAPLYLTEHCI